jgi:hypothetical protein
MPCEGTNVNDTTGTELTMAVTLSIRDFLDSALLKGIFWCIWLVFQKANISF